MPGVLMIEAMAQLGGTVILSPGEFQRKTPFLTGIDKVKFRRPVIPGDRLMMEIEMLRSRRNIGWVDGRRARRRQARVLRRVDVLDRRRSGARSLDGRDRSCMS